MKPDPEKPHLAKSDPAKPEPVQIDSVKSDPVTLDAAPSTPDAVNLVLPDLEATQRLAERLAPHLTPGLRIGLEGGLGAGKTTFVRALLAALGHPGRVRSPTFTLHVPYVVRGQTIHHFDLYRFGNPREWLDAGFDELIESPAISLIEWPQMARGVLPDCDLQIVLDPVEGTGLDDSAGSENGTGDIADGGAEPGSEPGSEPDSEPDSKRRASLIAHSARGQSCLRAAGL